MGICLLPRSCRKDAFGTPSATFQDVKKGASFNPYLRDKMVTGLAMACRGEMSFIIAAFAVGAGLFGAQVYAAIVWAVLLSCITCPFMLLHTIKYFKKRQQEYLAMTNPMKSKSADGKMPLFLHVQTKSQVQWGMQQKFRSVLNELGFEIMDQKTNHENRRGLNALVQTDIYVQDTKNRIQLRTIKGERMAKKAIKASCRNLTELGEITSKLSKGNLSSENLKSMDLSVLPEEERVALEDTMKEGDLIIARCREVRDAILHCIGLDDATAEVAPWNPWDWSTALDIMSLHNGGQELSINAFMELFDKIDVDGGGSVDKDELFEALKEAGAVVSKDGLDAMVAMVDVDGDGEIDRKEWKEAIEFYIEKKKESMGISTTMPDRRKHAILSTPMEADGEAYSNVEVAAVTRQSNPVRGSASTDETYLRRTSTEIMSGDSLSNTSNTSLGAEKDVGLPLE